MATIVRTQYEVRRVIRNGPKPEINHDNFPRRLEVELNDLANMDWTIVDICVGRFDALIVASAEFNMEED